MFSVFSHVTLKWCRHKPYSLAPAKMGDRHLPVGDISWWNTESLVGD